MLFHHYAFRLLALALVFSFGAPVNAACTNSTCIGEQIVSLKIDTPQQALMLEISGQSIDSLSCEIYNGRLLKLASNVVFPTALADKLNAPNNETLPPVNFAINPNQTLCEITALTLSDRDEINPEVSKAERLEQENNAQSNNN